MFKFFMLVLSVLIVPFVGTLAVTMNIATAATMLAAVFASAYLAVIVFGFDEAIRHIGNSRWDMPNSYTVPAGGIGLLWGLLTLAALFMAATEGNPLIFGWVYGTTVGVTSAGMCRQTSAEIARRVVYTLRGLPV